MKIEERKPRATRFGADSHEVRLAALREHAPTLGTSPRLRVYAILGSILMLLTVTGFYFAMQIYKTVTENRNDDALIQVDASPPALKDSEAEKALKRVEEEQAREVDEYQKQLEELKQIDLQSEPEADAP